MFGHVTTLRDLVDVSDVGFASFLNQTDSTDIVVKKLHYRWTEGLCVQDRNTETGPPSLCVTVSAPRLTEACYTDKEDGEEKTLLVNGPEAVFLFCCGCPKAGNTKRRVVKATTFRTQSSKERRRLSAKSVRAAVTGQRWYMDYLVSVNADVCCFTKTPGWCCVLSEQLLVTQGWDSGECWSKTRWSNSAATGATSNRLIQTRSLYAWNMITSPPATPPREQFDLHWDMELLV